MSHQSAHCLIFDYGKTLSIVLVLLKEQLPFLISRIVIFFIFAENSDARRGHGGAMAKFDHQSVTPLLNPTISPYSLYPLPLPIHVFNSSVLQTVEVDLIYPLSRLHFGDVMENQIEFCAYNFLCSLPYHDSLE